MKVRDSGMPPEDMWSGFFDPVSTLKRFAVGGDTDDVADFGSGYGTFAIPAARIVRGTVHAFDIEESMVAAARLRASDAGVRNIAFHHRDFAISGTGLRDACIDVALLFNILHAEQPVALLREAWRILKPGGRAAIMHWVHDQATPRGPSLDIRPTPEQSRRWAQESGFARVSEPFALPPYHYGLVCRKAGS